jgi:hypothetical protein
VLEDAAARYGLDLDVPSRLISAAPAHPPAAGSVEAATRTTATELGIDPRHRRTTGR